MPDTLDYSLMIAPNGARRTTADHPALPVTAADLARTARACQLEGATAIHLHIRDDAQRHSLDPHRYRDAMAAVAEQAPRLGLQITTESAGATSPPTSLPACRRSDPLPRASQCGRWRPIRGRAAGYAFADEAGIELPQPLRPGLRGAVAGLAPRRHRASDAETGCCWFWVSTPRPETPDPTTWPPCWQR